MAEAMIDEQEPGVLYSSFVPETGELLVVRPEGTQLLDTSHPGNVHCLATIYCKGHVTMIDKAGTSAIVAYVTSCHPRRLNLHHTRLNRSGDSISFEGNIVGVKIRRQFLVVLLADAIYVYDLEAKPWTIKTYHTVTDLPCMQWGLMALCDVIDDVTLLAFPGHDQSGVVMVYDVKARQMAPLNGHPVHQATLEALVFNQDGKRLATASQLGTVIRVWAVPSFQKLYEFRRGVRNLTTVHCLTFSPCGALLAAVSDRPTVHVFKMADQAGESEEEEELAREGGGWGEWAGSMVKAVGQTASNVLGLQNFTLDRSFAYASLPEATAAGKKVCAFVYLEDKILLNVAVEAGKLPTYELPPGGGTMRLLSTNTLERPQPQEKQEGDGEPSLESDLSFDTPSSVGTEEEMSQMSKQLEQLELYRKSSNEHKAPSSESSCKTQ